MPSYTAERIIQALGLQPHPREGGWFVETYRAAESTDGSALPSRYGDSRSLSTAIYYLLTHDTFSEMHRLASDETFHFYMGDTVEMLLLRPDGSGSIHRLGTNLQQDCRPQVHVPHGTWQGARLMRPHGYALLGCTVAPGFEFEDYESGDRQQLIRQYPAFHDQIEALTAEPGQP